MRKLILTCLFLSACQAVSPESFGDALGNGGFGTFKSVSTTPETVSIPEAPGSPLAEWRAYDTNCDGLYDTLTDGSAVDVVTNCGSQSGMDLDSPGGAAIPSIYSAGSTSAYLSFDGGDYYGAGGVDTALSPAISSTYTACVMAGVAEVNGAHFVLTASQAADTSEEPWVVFFSLTGAAEFIRVEDGSTATRQEFSLVGQYDRYHVVCWVSRGTNDVLARFNDATDVDTGSWNGDAMDYLNVGARANETPSAAFRLRHAAIWSGDVLTAASAWYAAQWTLPEAW